MWQLIESVEPVDNRTLVVYWKQPFIRADQIFESRYPTIFLKTPSTVEEERFLSQPYWTRELSVRGLTATRFPNGTAT